ncbi:MAG: TetR family transcriptional regulator [Acidobacteria bacterium]|nr:MAG: TetR family transcriptional regulator [Acidobacteriota bacterium]
MPNEHLKDEPAKEKPENPITASAAGEKRGDKYQRILEAAVEVIAEHGFFNARVADIAQRAGVADGTIYLYFKSKDQILMAAISNAFGAFLELARAEVKSASEPRDQLRRLALLHLTSLGSNRNLAIVFQTELRQSARFLAQFSQHQLKQYFDLIREVVRKGQDQGVFRGDLSDKIVANCFFGSLDEMVTSWLLSERDYSLPGAADAVVDVILGGVETRRPS